MNWPVLKSTSWPSGHLSLTVLVSGNSICTDSIVISVTAFGIFYLRGDKVSVKERGVKSAMDGGNKLKHFRTIWNIFEQFRISPVLGSEGTIPNTFARNF